MNHPGGEAGPRHRTDFRLSLSDKFQRKPQLSQVRRRTTGNEMSANGWKFLAVLTQEVIISPRPGAIFDNRQTTGRPEIILAGANPQPFEEMTLVIQEPASRSNPNRTS